MKFSALFKANQELLEALETAKDRKKRARHKSQHRTDPKTKAPKSQAVNCWEFLVDPFTPNNGPGPGAYRLLRRQQGSEVSWWWLKHLGNDSSFSYEQITDIPSFKPVRETEKEEAAAPDTSTPHTESVLERQEVSEKAVAVTVVPDDWENA